MRAGAQRNWTDALEIVSEGIPMSVRELTTLTGVRIKASELSNVKRSMIFYALPMMMAALHGVLPSSGDGPLVDILDGGLQGGVNFYFSPEERARWAETFEDVTAITEDLLRKLLQAEYVRGPAYTPDQQRVFAKAYVDASFFIGEVRARTKEDSEFFAIETEQLKAGFKDAPMHEREAYAEQALWIALKERFRTENEQAFDDIVGGALQQL